MLNVDTNLIQFIILIKQSLTEAHQETFTAM